MIFTKRIAVASLALAFAACSNRNSLPLVIQGKLTNAPAGTIYLERSESDASRPVVIDSGVVNKDGSYRIQTYVDEPMMLSLRAGKDVYPFAYLINDSRQITVNADLGAQPRPYATIQGSAASEARLDYDTVLRNRVAAFAPLALQTDSVFRLQPTDSLSALRLDSVKGDYIGRARQSLDGIKSYVEGFIGKASSPILVLYALQTYDAYVAQRTIPELFSRFDKSGFVREAAARFPENKALADLKAKLPSALAPELTMADTSGKSVALSSFRGKWVLVDFWASWCQPCRMENPNVVEAFNKFKDRNFTIVGVSLDANREAWIRAIQQDGLAWSHISDLKEWKSAAVTAYEFNGIPYNVLVDPQGQIVAENLRGAQLEEALSRFVK